MWKKAYLDTRSYFGWNRKTLIPPLVIWIIGAIIYWQWQGWEAMKEEISIAVAFIVSPILLYLLGAYFFNLIRAPVLIKWEKERAPRLAVDGIKESSYGRIGQSWGLVIENKSTDRADDCVGQLVKIEFADSRVGQSLFRWPVNQPLQWASIPISSSKSISIPGLGKDILQIVNYDPIRIGKNELHIAYYLSEEYRKEHYLPKNTTVGGNDYLIVISITSLNSHPVYAICLMVNRILGSLMMFLETTNEEPSLEECRRVLTVHKAEIEKQLVTIPYQ